MIKIVGVPLESSCLWQSKNFNGGWTVPPGKLIKISRVSSQFKIPAPIRRGSFSLLASLNFARLYSANFHYQRKPFLQTDAQRKFTLVKAKACQ